MMSVDVTEFYHLSLDHRRPSGVPCYSGETRPPHHCRPVRPPVGQQASQEKHVC